MVSGDGPGGHETQHLDSDGAGSTRDQADEISKSSAAEGATVSTTSAGSSEPPKGFGVRFASSLRPILAILGGFAALAMVVSCVYLILRSTAERDLHQSEAEYRMLEESKNSEIQVLHSEISSLKNLKDSELRIANQRIEDLKDRHNFQEKNTQNEIEQLEERDRAQSRAMANLQILLREEQSENIRLQKEAEDSELKSGLTEAEFKKLLEQLEQSMVRGLRDGIGWALHYSSTDFRTDPRSIMDMIKMVRSTLTDFRRDVARLSDFGAEVPDWLLEETMQFAGWLEEFTMRVSETNLDSVNEGRPLMNELIKESSEIFDVIQKRLAELREINR